MEVFKYYKAGKKKYKVGEYYNFEELPEEAQEDFELQQDEYDENEYLFRFDAIDPEEYLEERYGDDLEEALDDPYISQLAKDIKKYGLKSPPIGTEGNHRALAYLKLGVIMPYFHIEPVSDEDSENEEY